ncbi:tubulin-specific chaperone C [Clonorchis sinensis]|uniref:Tubulin-specific chaperone C n=1 Tax=Clonorchis sinensis TaxID=79923 RepID=H2KRI4_CLOSI|nr:tubulin-specific chaperone C [Clonorchis sinensis]
MASLDQGDGANPQTPRTAQISSREALISRLAERQAQLKAAQLSRIQKQKDAPGVGFEKSYDFLPRFQETKAGILSDLDKAADQLSNGSISTSEVTRILDETVGRIEELQKSLNDASLYLTSFDSEQARLELKNLNSQFQAKREQLLPTKKFAFSRKPKSVPSSTALRQSHPDQSKESLGQEFQSVSSFDANYSWTDCEGPQTLLLPKSASQGGSDSLIGQSVYLADLANCTVHVRGVCGNLIARRLTRCRVYTYPVAGSVWIENCVGCDFILACRQLRIHSTSDSRLGLHMASRPIIEHSSGLHVAPYPIHYPDLSADLLLAGLSEDVNFWREVEDFSHPNKRMTTGSPNWSVLPESEWDTLKPPIIETTVTQ